MLKFKFKFKFCVCNSSLVFVMGVVLFFLQLEMILYVNFLSVFEGTNKISQTEHSEFFLEKSIFVTE